MPKFDLGPNGGVVPEPKTSKTESPAPESGAKMCHLGIEGVCIKDRCMAWNDDEDDCQDLIERDEKIQLLNRINTAIDDHGESIALLLAKQFGPMMMKAEPDDPKPESA